MGEKGKTIIEEKGWLPLDNAAKIYPAVMNKELTSVFRISCCLNTPVKIGALQEAIRVTTGRFPYFNTTLRKGFFWFYLQYDKNIIPPLVCEDNRPLVAFPSQSVSNALYRILARDRRISVEFLHILTDGGGALEFLRSLLVTYFRCCGEKISYSDGVIEPGSTIDPEETEDSFKKYYIKGLPEPSDMTNSWHLPNRLKKPSNITVTEAEIDILQLKKETRKKDVTITEYLTAVYLFSLQSIFYKVQKENNRNKDKEKIIRVEVPINLRKLLPSKTLRNFALFVMPELNTRLGIYTFDEILRVVYHYIRSETDIKLIKRIITRNVKPENSLIVRLTPLFVKNIVLTAAFHKHGATKYAGVLTNLGIVRMPVEAENNINSFSIFPPPPTRKLKVSCGVVSYGTKLRMVFCNITDSLELERKILSFLASRKIRIKLINNKFSHGKQDMP